MKQYKINGTLAAEFLISENDLRYQLVSFLNDKFNWKEAYFIEDDNVCEMVNYSTSHTYLNKEKIRAAQTIDKALYTLYKELSKI
jgi:hypothetical protein